MIDLSSITIGEAFGTLAAAFAFISIFVEITPIKINPISSFFGWVGKKANENLSNELNDIKNVVNSLDGEVKKVREVADERNAINCRVRILRFGDEILHDQLHSKESFDQVLADIDTYDSYCEEHPDFKNNKTVITTKRIMDVYEECLSKDSFL